MTLKNIIRNIAGSVSAGRKAAVAIFAIGGALLLPYAIGSIDGLVSPRAHAETIAPTAGGSTFSDEQKKALGEIIKDYLIKNPEIMIDVQNALDEKMQKDQDAKLKSFMTENGKSIFRSPGSSVAGDPNGDITVVEFFDYNCGYCKRGLPEVQKLIQNDKKVRFVFKELPILSKGSEEAARVALAVKRQGKYWEFHQAMLGSKGHADEASALKIAESLGLDMNKIKADMASDEVKNELRDDLILAKKMGINGTPHFLVGDKSIPGAPDDLHDQLEALVSGFRKNGCPIC
ncbi:DSBA oxidoreductase [Hyphomicrobium denitrificans 1NES1]|uniref:DSBA oxidoreductase n=1 Tax=Hyphomicrobium denitrificans 1NES1 TaxID=670307 RepID=N0B9K6_9HYPH|nr:DsbA family protein [Hyphomicrobium denitrificans]AGK57216.1 DSBA oxidoreductase [Hyphomicrobium denitrificans 1NES1]